MFALKQYLTERKRIIDKELDRLIPKSSIKPTILHKAMRYSVFSGGKRIRPILCLAAAEAIGFSYRKALIPAIAIELLHTYTLIHDDLPCMDNDDFRRGKSTSHRVFGEANAILAGDALQAFAFEILAKVSVPKPYPPSQLIFELAQAAGSRGVVGGQVEDIAATGRHQTRAMIEFIHLHKTADLFKAAARIGAIVGGASRQQLSLLTQYGINLGLAFQITDDILDKLQPNVRSAKKRKMPELTCLSILTSDEAHRYAKTLINKAISTISDLKSRAYPLISIAQFVLNRPC